MNYLKAVFWDYLQFTEKDDFKLSFKDNIGSNIYRWIMSRFLEHGRVKYFNLLEITEQSPKLKLSSSTYKKWLRLIEVYGIDSEK
jgi:hypothetical protein